MDFEKCKKVLHDCLLSLKSTLHSSRGLDVLTQWIWLQAIFWTGRLGHLWLGSSNNASRFNNKTILMISPDPHLGPTLVPNRTGMRETESTVGRSSIQVCCLMRIMPSVLLLMLYICSGSGRPGRAPRPTRCRPWHAARHCGQAERHGPANIQRGSCNF